MISSFVWQPGCPFGLPKEAALLQLSKLTNATSRASKDKTSKRFMLFLSDWSMLSTCGTFYIQLKTEGASYRILSEKRNCKQVCRDAVNRYDLVLSELANALPLSKHLAVSLWRCLFVKHSLVLPFGMWQAGKLKRGKVNGEGPLLVTELLAYSWHQRANGCKLFPEIVAPAQATTRQAEQQLINSKHCLSGIFGNRPTKFPPGRDGETGRSRDSTWCRCRCRP